MNAAVHVFVPRALGRVHTKKTRGLCRSRRSTLKKWQKSMKMTIHQRIEPGSSHSQMRILPTILHRFLPPEPALRASPMHNTYRLPLLTFPSDPFLTLFWPFIAVFSQIFIFGLFWPVILTLFTIRVVSWIISRLKWSSRKMPLAKLIILAF